MARAIRAARFDNLWTAAELFNELTEEELASAEKACIHYDFPIRIRELVKALPEVPSGPLPSLAIDFCCIRCENPFFLASSAVCTNYERGARAF